MPSSSHKTLAQLIHSYARCSKPDRAFSNRNESSACPSTRSTITVKKLLLPPKPYTCQHQHTPREEPFWMPPLEPYTLHPTYSHHADLWFSSTRRRESLAFSESQSHACKIYADTRSHGPAGMNKILTEPRWIIPRQRRRHAQQVRRATGRETR